MRWTTFSPSLAGRITGCPWILQIKMMLGSSLTTRKVPWMKRYVPMLKSMSWKMSRRGQMRQLMHLLIIYANLHALIDYGSDATVEFEVQCRVILAIPDGHIELQKEHLKVSQDKGVSHLLEICYTCYAIESGAVAVCAAKTISALQKSHQSWKQPEKHTSQCQNCTCQHPPQHDNCPSQESVCKGCLKKGQWQAKCCSSKKNQSTAPVESQSKGTSGQHGKKGKKADLIGVHTEEPPCDEIFLDDVHAPHTNETYTTVHLPASASNKGMASLQVKVDTCTSRNVLPLHLFRHPYPGHID